jgi:hypothetical protein
VDPILPIFSSDRTVPAVELTRLTPLELEREREKQRRERERRRRQPAAEAGQKARPSGDDGPAGGIDVRV